MTEDAFERRRRGFEEEFFKKQSDALIAKLQRVLEQEHTRETLQKLTGITDDAVLDTLMKLHVNRDTFAAFGLYPLVEVAWADGAVDERERQAFLAAAAEHGVAPGSPSHAALEEFLKATPREDARRAWFAWANELNKKLDPAERRKVREGLVKRARAVAEASGGLLGFFGTKVSAKEQAILDAIERAFPD